MANRDDAPEDGATITRDEAQAWFTRFLLRRIRRDDYPSTTQLDLIEKSIPREMLAQYLRVLVDKVAGDMFPSVPLLRRIQHLIKRLPHSEYEHRPRRAGRDDTEQDVTAPTASDEKDSAPASTRPDDEQSP
jgi:DNA-nicking Smr family endonuclease